MTDDAPTGHAAPESEAGALTAPSSRMPRPVRAALTGLSFAMFFVGSLLIGVVGLPLMLPLAGFDLRRYRRWCTRTLGAAYVTFLFWMKVAGLVDYAPFEPPQGLEGRPYVVVANHPSLIDVLFFLHYMPGLTCVVKAAWYRSPLLGLLLRSTNYLPGPGADEDLRDSPTPALDRMVAHLGAGHPLLVFPEGTRSPAPTTLRRFHRGPFEAAARAGVPVVVVRVSVDQPFLRKGVPFWKVPARRVRYGFEHVGTLEPPRAPEDMRRSARALVEPVTAEG